MNLCIMTGNAVRDPEMKVSVKSGRQFCVFRLAVEGPYRGRDLPREIDFINFMAFGKMAHRIHTHMRKGNKCLVTGTYKTYEKIDEYGNRKMENVIIVRQFEFFNRIIRDDPIEDLVDTVTGEYLIPKEITKSFIKQVDDNDVDMPDEFVRRLDGTDTTVDRD